MNTEKLTNAFDTLLRLKTYYWVDYDGEPLFDKPILADDAQEAYKLACDSLDGDYYDPELVNVSNYEFDEG